MLPRGAKERFSRAGETCSAGDLELIGYGRDNGWNAGIYARWRPLNKLHPPWVIFPIDLQLGNGVRHESIIFDFHERWWALHSLGGDLKSIGKTSDQQQVPEPFWYHCKPLDFVRSEANLTTTALEPLHLKELLPGYCWDLQMSCSSCTIT